MHLVRIIAILSVFVATTQVASADAILRLTSGASTVTIADGSALDLSAGADGVIVFSGGVGVFTVNVSTGVTKPTLGGTNDPRLDLNSININGGGAGTLMIEFTDTDFGPAPYPGFETAVGGTTSGSVSFASYYDLGNVEFETSSALSVLGPFGGGAFSGTVSNPVGPLPEFYSLTLVATITHTSIGSSSFNAELHPNPEPSTLVLLGAAAFGFAALRRRRRAG